MFGGSGISLADIAAVTRNNNGNGDGFGGNNGWWILIILWALWGRNGFGDQNGNQCCCNSGNGGGAGTMYYVGADLQRGFDNSTVIAKLDGINNGICSLGYDQLAQMNGINTNIMQSTNTLQNAIQQQTIAQMQDTNALSRQLGDCCCENRQAIAQVRYDMATDTCAVTTAVSNAARDIIENQNANYRALHEENVQARIEALNAQLREKDSLIQSLNLSASQANQNNTIRGYVQQAVAELKDPCPVPAYWVQNPNCCSGPWGPFDNNGNFYGRSGCCNRCN